MTRHLKNSFLVAAGLGWVALALGFLFLLFQYVTQGAGLQVFSFFDPSSVTVSIGLVHVTGFAAAAFLSFAIGAALCAHGLVPPQVHGGSPNGCYPEKTELG